MKVEELWERKNALGLIVKIININYYVNNVDFDVVIRVIKNDSTTKYYNWFDKPIIGEEFIFEQKQFLNLYNKVM